VIRRCVRHTDPLLLPVVALLNEHGLVLNLAAGGMSPTELHGSQAAHQVLWTVLGVGAFAAVVWRLTDHRRFGRYLFRVAGLVLLAVPTLPPARLVADIGHQTGLTTPWTTAAASGPTGPLLGRWSSDRRRAGLLR